MSLEVWSCFLLLILVLLQVDSRRLSSFFSCSLWGYLQGNCSTRDIFTILKSPRAFSTCFGKIAITYRVKPCSTHEYLFILRFLLHLRVSSLGLSHNSIYNNVLHLSTCWLPQCTNPNQQSLFSTDTHAHLHDYSRTHHAYVTSFIVPD